MTSNDFSRPALRFGALLAGCVLTLGMAVSAQAARDFDALPTVTVKYNDLNLATEAGARTLYRRIVLAANQVCPQYESRGVEVSKSVTECRNAAVEHAVRAVNNMHLAAIYAASSKRG